MRAPAALLMAACLIACGDRPSVEPGPVPARDRWSATGITATRKPQRVLLRKDGWRGGPEALIVEAKEADALRLHALLAGNQRLEYLCGFHWSVGFEYEDGAFESIAINEQCESFRRDGDELQRLLTSYFKRTSDRPSHSLLSVTVRDRGSKSAVKRELEARIGPAFNTDPAGTTLLLARPEPWTSKAAEEVRRFEGVAKVQLLETYDTGS